MYTSVLFLLLSFIVSIANAVRPLSLNQNVLAFNSDFEGLQDIYVNDLSLLELHKSLIEIESISNAETNVALYLKKYLENTGLTVELQEIHDEYEKRYNVYAYLGKTRNTKVLLTSHIDTVPPYLTYNIDGTKIYGRGSCDAKGSVATQIITFLSLVDRGLLKEGDVSLLFVVGEEVSGVGMKLAEDLHASWDIGIFGEPTELKLGRGHKGIIVFKLIANGKASHSGYPELGVSASEILVPVLNSLLNLKLPTNDLLGPSTLNIGEFSGGVAANVIPANAEALVSIRVATDADEVLQSVKDLIKDVPNLEFELHQKTSPQYLDFDIDDFETIALAYGTDIPNLTVELKKRYLFGPGSIHVAHSDHEFIENSDLIQAVKDYERIIKYALTN
ncbi:hypothetical protein DFJ63DRAFT_315750 [Scheffersomyces coipomensis]|uniref:uncharacterized protein n=1 Tax=Scheffersomyces coipomensis TaxID=1788519 RepID=UPI00315DB586